MDKSSARLFVLHTKYLITYFYFTSITHSSIIYRINWETELLVRLELTILKRPLNNDELCRTNYRTYKNLQNERRLINI